MPNKPTYGQTNATWTGELDRRDDIFGGPDDGRRYPGDRSPGAGPKQPNLTPDDPQWLCISSRVFHWDIYMLLGDGLITPSEGVGGWESVERARDVAATNWGGRTPWNLEVPVMLDDWIEDVTVEPDPERKKAPPSFDGRWENMKKKKRRRKVKRARRRWRRYRDQNAPDSVEDMIELIISLGLNEDKDAEPPKFRVYGKAMPHWLNGDQFVLVGIDWGDKLFNKAGGIRRQALTLRLLKYTDYDDYKLKRRKKRKGKGGGGKKRTYTVKKGDTLQKIAAKVYGDPHKWKRIAKANDIRNPRKLKVGSVLKIP